MRRFILTFASLCLVLQAPADDPAGHWSFLPIKDVSPPQGEGDGVEHPIDRFIRAAQNEANLEPVSAADRRTLIRRAYFDLIGLPPTPKQISAFLADEEPDAFGSVVEELLASPRYGERWGRYWLDLARYADTAGENSDYPVREAYRYRDYVIGAFNEDIPYDVFIHEQLAGDILAKADGSDRFAERTIATGFMAQSKRFGTHKLEDMHLIIEDTMNTMGQSVLGLSLRCARCHDHKYDPITIRDYYALYGFFKSTAYPFPGGEEVKRPSEFVPTLSAAELAERDKKYLAEHEGEIKKLNGEVERIRKANPTDEEETLAAKLKPAGEKLKRINDRKPSAVAPLAYAVREGKPVDARIQLLGNPNKPGEVVKRGVPKFLDHVAKIDVPADGSGRLELARWLTHADHPLTARVMANRIWQHHFGKPIVPTPSDFGLRGEPPTHPDLLDWLAAEFMRRDWSIKSMHRLIMGSKTYQLASTDNKKNMASDPTNRLNWRFVRRRLDAEAIRDSMLAVGGNLDLNRPGEHPFPPVDKWGFTAHHQFKAVYPSDHRSVYLMVQRLHHHPFLALFDGPDASASTAVRDRSTVAHQALFLVNSEFVHRQARGLGQRLISSSEDRTERIRNAYELAYARPPTAAEVTRAERFLEQYLEALKTEGLEPKKREEEAWGSFARVILGANEFIYVD